MHQSKPTQSAAIFKSRSSHVADGLLSGQDSLAQRVEPSFFSSDTPSHSYHAPQLQGHEAVLNAIQKSGRTIYVEVSDNVYSGRLIARDAQTLTVEMPRWDVPGADAPLVRRVFFRTAVVSFWADEYKKD